LPAKSLEEILDLNATLSNETRVFEALEEEKFPFAGNILIQSLENTAQRVLDQLDLKNCSLEAQVSLLSLLGTSFKAQTLKAFNAQKLKEFDQGTLDFLLYHAKDKASLELLFALKANPKTRNEQGETPLYARVKALKPEDQETTWPLLKALIEGGVDLNTGTEAETVLDLVLERGLDFTFTNLLELNTFRWTPRHPLKVNSELLLKRYRQWIKEGRQNTELAKAFKLLSQMSPQRAWHMALEEVLPPPQPVSLSYEGLLKIAREQLKTPRQQKNIERMIEDKEPLEEIKETIEDFLGHPLTSLQGSGEKIQGIFMGERCLLPEVKNQLFDETGKVRRSNTYGRRDVARVEHQGKVLYFKYLPELPGFEYGMYLLYRKLIGHGIPPSELVKIGSQPYLVSLEIGGQNLADVIKETPDLLKQLDLQSLSDLIHMVTLTNPEDDQPANRILKPHPFRPGVYLFESPDNDHALMPTVARTNEDPQASKTLLQVKSILYCLDQMKDLVSQETKDLFASLNPYEVLKGWLQKLKKVNRAYSRLFPNEEAEVFIREGCVVCIPFKPQMITQLYDKMVRLQRILAPKKGKPTKALANQDIFKELEHLLHKRYAVGFEKPLTVAERFELINGHFYRRDSATGYISTTSSSLLLKSMGIPIEESLIDAVRRGGYLTVDTAMEELEAIRAETDKELLGGDKAVEHLKLLKSENARAQFLSRLDFKDLELSQQQALLRLFKESDPRSLTFRNCQALTPHILLNEIGVGNLTRLTIENNASLDDAFMKELETRNGGLKALTLANLPRLTRIQGNFPHLTTLSLNEHTKKRLGYFGLSSSQRRAGENSLYEVPENPPQITLRREQSRFSPKFITDFSPYLGLGVRRIERSFPHLTTLTIKDCSALRTLNLTTPRLQKLVATGCPLLEEVKVSHPILCLLDFSHNASLTDEVLDALLITQPRLKVLKVENSPKISFPEIRSANHKYPICYLKVLNDKKTQRFFQEFYSSIVRLLKQDQTLQTLDLRCFEAKAMEASALSEALNINTTLKCLLLGLNLIEHAGAKRLGNTLKINSTLTALDLYGNNIGDEGTKILGKRLKINKSLTELHLYNNQINIGGASGLSKALKVNTTLRLLTLGGNNIGDGGTKSLGEAIKVNSALQQLDLAGNKIGDNGVKALSEALRANTTLQQLNLDTNNIKDQGAGSLGEALKINTTLQQLALMQNNIGAGGVKILGESLKVNFSLKGLYLSDNIVGNEGAKILGDALKFNTSLRSLYLTANAIGKEGARALSSALKINSSLKVLILGGTFGDNNVGNKGAKALGKALQVNTTLKVLELGENNIGTKGIIALGEGLKVNVSLKRLELKYNQMKNEGLQELNKALKANPSIQSFDLKKNYQAGPVQGIAYRFHRLNRQKIPFLQPDSSIITEEPSSLPLFLQGTSLEGIFFTLSSFSALTNNYFNSLNEERSTANISFACKSFSPPSFDLLDTLDGERGSLIQQLLNLKDQRVFREALSLDIREAFLKSLLPREMQDARFHELDQEKIKGKKSGFEERLKAYTEDISTYRHYVRFVLGNTENALQHTLHGGSLRAMAKLQGL
ncbi:MAG: hypothetical protein BGO67_10180, partial [Alphaproteobacteria bacterium 41-28]